MYELWEMASYGHGEPLFPIVLNAKSSNFEEIYIKFKKLIDKQPCVITFAEKSDNK